MPRFIACGVPAPLCVEIAMRWLLFTGHHFLLGSVMGNTKKEAAVTSVGSDRTVMVTPVVKEDRKRPLFGCSEDKCVWAIWFVVVGIPSFFIDASGCNNTLKRIDSPILQQ